MRQSLFTPKTASRHAQSTPQELINAERAAQVYGTRAFIPVVSNAAPSPGYYSLKKNHQLPSTQRRVQLQPKGP